MQDNSNSLEILIATMNQNSLLLLDKMFSNNWKNLKILIVNQTTPENLLNSDFENVRVINSFEKGLSKSRNLAIKNAVGDILLITDDDVIFKNDFEELIQKAYFENPNAAMIAFSTTNENGKLYKKYPKTVKANLNYFDLYNIMSIEITLKKANFTNQRQEFDENFGLGSSFPIGEEGIFLSDLKKKKNQLIVVPEVIGSHSSLSTINKIKSDNYYYNLGAIYTRNHKNRWWIWVLIKIAFDLKQNKIKIIQVITYLKCSIIGRKMYNNLIINRD